LCFVEIDGFERPVTSCTEKVREGLVVRTDTPPVRRLQRMAFKLLMSGHPCDAKVCPVKGGCQLIRIAKHLKVGLNPKPLEFIKREVDEEVDLIFFTYYPFRCVLCGKCVYVCREKNGHNLLTFTQRGFEKNGHNLLTFTQRGFDTVIGFFGSSDPAALTCHTCLACATICPTGALVPKSGLMKETASNP